MNQLNFGQALDAIKAGKRIARTDVMRELSVVLGERIAAFF